MASLNDSMFGASLTIGPMGIHALVYDVSMLLDRLDRDSSQLKMLVQLGAELWGLFHNMIQKWYSVGCWVLVELFADGSTRPCCFAVHCNMALDFRKDDLEAKAGAQVSSTSQGSSDSSKNFQQPEERSSAATSGRDVNIASKHNPPIRRRALRRAANTSRAVVLGNDETSPCLYSAPQQETCATS